MKRFGKNIVGLSYLENGKLIKTEGKLKVYRYHIIGFMLNIYVKYFTNNAFLYNFLSDCDDSCSRSTHFEGEG